MRGGRRVWLLAGGVMALAASLGSVCWIGLQRPADASTVTSGALAVVLLPRADGSRLAVVDLASSRVVRRIELRSLATDIAVDTSSGLVVGAQAGGFGPAIDRAASLTDVRTGAVRYVDLPVIDPGDVACVGGRAFLLHSTLEASGTAFSVADVASGRVTGSGNIPGPPGLWASAAGAIWSTGSDSAGRPSLRRIDSRTLCLSTFGLGGFLPTGLVEAGGRLLVLGTDDASGQVTSGAVVAIDPGEGTAVARGTVVGLARSPQCAVQIGGRLVLGDWNGDEPEGRVLRLLDATTLHDLGSLGVDGIPCALAAWGDRLLVVDRERGRLLVVDPATGRTTSAIELGERDLVFSDVVVVGERK